MMRSVRATATIVRHFFLAGMVMGLLLSGGCGGRSAPPEAGKPAPRRLVAGQSNEGIRIKVSEPKELSAGRGTPLPQASGVPLSDKDTRRLLERLPALAGVTGDRKAFAMRERSLPAPRTGDTVKGKFPPPPVPDKPPTDTTGPLQVIRHAPDGNVPIVPALSVTFNQPMVAVTSHAELAAAQLPVKLDPEPPGKWRWIGTQTLLFEPENGFPKATEYKVTVPEGTSSALRNKLASAVNWKFRTPPPEVQGFYPESGPQVCNPVIFVSFDQKIDPAAVLRTITVKAGGTPAPVRLATEEEVKGNEVVSTLASSAIKGRWLAFRPVAPFSPDTRIQVDVGPETPSLEGPLTTKSAQSRSFSTYGPMKIVHQNCDETRYPCTPGSALSLQFSNPIDEERYQDSMVKVTPRLDGMKVQVSGESLVITGRTKARTDYTVTIDGTMPDAFGQTMGKPDSRTFHIGPAHQQFTGSGGPLVVIDPSGPPVYSVFTANERRLRVRLFSVTPDDWRAFLKYSQEMYNRTPPPTPGKAIEPSMIEVAGKPDELTETRIDLSPALKGGLGHAVLIVEPDRDRKKDEYVPRVIAWCQVTHIGLDAFVDHQSLLGWASSLGSGSPLEGVQMSVLPGGGMGTTAADGTARLSLSGAGAVQVGPGEYWNAGSLLVARKGDDVAMLPEGQGYYYGGGSWHRRDLSDSLSWYVFDDRKMYRPGESVHIKGWMRVVGNGPKGDVSAPAGEITSIAWTVTDSRGNKVAEGKAPVNALAGFAFEVKLPKTMNLGHAQMSIVPSGPMRGVPGNATSHSFQVQEFRRPEFEVKAANEKEGPFFVGGQADVSVQASYYAGGGLPNAPVNWQVSATTGSFVPPGRSEYSFGPYRPFWGGPYLGGEYDEMPMGAYRRHPGRYHGSPVAVSGGGPWALSGRTDPNGKHLARLEFLSADPPVPVAVTAQASVTDVNRQTWTSSTNLLVHPAQLYVGVKTSRPFVEAGEPLHVDVIVSDLDGKIIAGRTVDFRAVLQDWKAERGRVRQVEVPVRQEKLSSTGDAVRVTLYPKEGGAYRLVADVRDDAGRLNRTEYSFWVAGGRTIPSRDVKQQKVTLIPDREKYQPGDEAKILVQSPFAPAEGLLTVRRNGIARTERFSMASASCTVKVPIDESYLGGVQVQVDVVGADPRTRDDGEVDPALGRRPAYATGNLALSVPPLARKLTLDVAPTEKAVEPGGKTTVAVTLKDAAGKPVAGGEVAVVVVDEAVLALTGYKLGDPLAVFYPARGGGVSDHHLRAQIVLANPQDVVRSSGRMDQEMLNAAPGGGPMPQSEAKGMPVPSAPMARKSSAAPSADSFAKEKDGGTGNGEPPPPIRMRSDFNPLALFAGALPTDADGRATVEVKVPDNLTRYRIMAVAVADGRQFGMADAALTARLPLMVRPSAPRFLNFGDRFELPVVVQNQTDRPMDVDVAVRCANAVLLPAGVGKEGGTVTAAGQRVKVPANDRVEVRFPAASLDAGTARFQVGGASGRWADAAQVALPVWTPATTEAFATYGQLDGNVAIQPVQAPGEVWPQFGGLEVTTSSTALQALTDAMIYLQGYPFECSEQLSSRILSVAALRDVLKAFKAEGLPSSEDMVAAMQRDIERLRQRQNDNGGWGFWRPNEDHQWPYLGIHVMHALQRAREKGYKVPDDTMQRGQGYLKNIEQHIPSWYGPQYRRVLVSYALYVRHRMGDRDTAKALSILREKGIEGVSFEALGWLLPVLSGQKEAKAEVAEIRRYLDNHVTETAADAHYVLSYGEGNYLLLGSDRRADAIVLEALIGDQPKSDLIVKLVNGLLDHRTKGHWANTQESVFALLALDRYFHTYEKVTPDFVARVWLGDRFAGEHKFKGRTTERFHVDIPMSYLAQAADGKPMATQNLTLGKAGKGRMYYRIGMQYAPRSLQMGPSEHGFTVERRYEGIDDPKDVRRDENGAWHIKAGAPVRVRVTMVAPARRYHVALVDPLPAGLEIVNPALAVSGSIPQDLQQMSHGGASSEMAWERYWRWAWMGTWYEHQNLRDERAEAFSSLLWEGVYTYTYLARATTPGIFVVPPPKAEEMYHPETFGRGSSDRVIVE